ncbi:hypothetical protein [Williamsia limnetica]|uniref:hypothetical protein n=1 Tax=Williamsia limnetica TaxID=882452 RepID=UPI001B875B30|nr:hypothetical protein [Williamsia limnetica]
MTESKAPDVHEVLGFRTVAARLLVAAFVITYALVAVNTSPPASFWYEFAAWLIMSLAAVALITVRGDPLPIPTTIALTAAGVVAMNLVLLKVAPPISGLQLWPSWAALSIYIYMCVRGRAAWAWIGLIAVLGSHMLWGQRTGIGYAEGLQLSVVKVAPLLMATFFAWRIRPASRRIFELRDQATLRVAAEAADKAVLEERDRRLAQLNELARPLLERLAGDSPLTEDQRLTAKLLEAHLRDTLRAPVFSTPAIKDCTRATRARGVEVVMLDDRRVDDISPETRNRLLGHVTDALECAESGTLTIRMLPPGRDVVLTILHRTPDDTTRFEYGLDAQLLDRAERAQSATASAPVDIEWATGPG